jgi:hypothetical protein
MLILSVFTLFILKRRTEREKLLVAGDIIAPTSTGMASAVPVHSRAFISFVNDQKGPVGHSPTFVFSRELNLLIT